MNSLKISKIRDDFRIKFAFWYLIIAIILIVCSLFICGSCSVMSDYIRFFDTFLWCLAFIFLGFCLLILKICINDIKIVADEDNTELLKQKKRRLRYRLFYPIFLIVFAVLSTTISFNKFSTLNEAQYFIGSALLSFFLGFFIDSIPNVIEKVGKALSS